MPIAQSLVLCGAITLASEFLYYRYSRQDASGRAFNSDLERAERKLAISGIFVRTFFILSILGKAAAFAGWIPDEVRRQYLPLLGIPFLIASLHYLKAWWDSKRARKAKPG